MNKSNVPNAKAKNVGQPHKSGTKQPDGAARRERSTHDQPGSAAIVPPLDPDDVVTIPIRPYGPKKPSHVEERAAEGDDDLMSDPQVLHGENARGDLPIEEIRDASSARASLAVAPPSLRYGLGTQFGPVWHSAGGGGSVDRQIEAFFAKK